MLKILLGVLLTALVAGGAYFMLFADGPSLLPDQPNDPGNPQVSPKDPVTPLQGGRTEDPERQDPVISRAEVNQATDDAADARQGITGRLVNEGGIPVAGARVYLVRGMGVSTFQMFARFQRGERFPPLASGLSGPDGKFRLGFRTWSDEEDLEVRILHPNYADARIERIRIQPEDWTETEDVVLKAGIRVHGQVTGPNGNGLPEATVTVTPTFANGLLSVPGRESGIVVKANANGYYEFKHLDRFNVSSISAYAPGHSRLTKPEIQLQQNDVLLNFQLQLGYEIGGVVASAEGKPIRGAQIAAFAHSQKSPQREDAYSDEKGAFLLTGLQDGKFRLTIEAEGYDTAQEALVEAGNLNVNVVLERLGSVIVRVRSSRGAVNRFKCNIKPVLNGGSYGKPLLSKEIRKAQNGEARIVGLKPMKYVAEIHARGFAKNFSAQFEVVQGQQQPPEVEVVMNQGGALRGTVRDQNGKAVPGVRVKTMPNNLVDNPLVRAFGGVPYTISRGETRTNGQGEFVIQNLHPGSYQLEFAHDDYCTEFLTGNDVRLNESTQVDAQMTRGSILSGVARVDGKPRGQVRVVLQQVRDPNAKAAAVFSTEATSDNEGRFLMPKRIPPGEYEYRAAQMNLGPFQVVLQMQKKTPVTVEGEHVQIVVEVQSARK